MLLILKGLLNKQTAAALGITEATVKVHRRHVMQKMAAESLPDLVRMVERVQPTG
jgi:FixJ family two-component response regulator